MRTSSSPLEKQQQTVQRAQDLRARLLEQLLRVVLAGGVLAYVPSAYLSIRQHIWYVLIADSIAFVYAVFVVAFSRRLSYRLKVLSFVFAFYVVGVIVLAYTGPFGAGELFLFAFVFLTALFGGVASIISANALAILTQGGFTVASALHIVPWPQQPGPMIVISVNFIMISLVLSYATGFLIRGYSGAAAEEKRLRKAVQAMLREIEHRVKNNLQVLASLVTLRAGPNEDPGHALEDIKGTLSAISVVHQLLYRKDAFYLVELNALLSSLTHRFRVVNPKIRFAYQWEGSGAEVDGDLAVTIGVMINEIVMNSAKHAFPGRADGQVSIEAHFDETNRVMQLEVEDDGCGMGDAPAGTGRQIIQALAQQLNAKMELGDGPGVRYDFRIPLAVPAAEPA